MVCVCVCLCVCVGASSNVLVCGVGGFLFDVVWFAVVCVFLCDMVCLMCV